MAPSVSIAQQEAAGADLARVRSGKKPRTFKNMDERELEKYARTKHKGLPERKSKRK